jgi:hypothetical protein
VKIYTKIVFDIETGKRLEEEFFEYEGPLALCDRAAQSQASQAAKTAGNVAAGYGGDASSIAGNLVPFLTQQMEHPQGYSQQDLGAMLTNAMGSAGGATAGLTGQAQLQAARTRNTSGFASALDEAARQRGKALSSTSAGIATQNADLKQRQQQQAANELQGLYGVDTGAQLKGMDIQNQDINSEIQAGKSGWLQNTLDILNTLSGAGNSAAKMKMAGML